MHLNSLILLTEAGIGGEEIYKKYYNNLPPYVFSAVVVLDIASVPNVNQEGVLSKLSIIEPDQIKKVGPIAKWLLKLLGNVKMDDTRSVYEVLRQNLYFPVYTNISDFISASRLYYKYKSKLKPEQKDINRYSSIYEFIEAMQIFTKEYRDTEIKEKETEYLFENENWIIISPLTQDAACLWGHTEEYGDDELWCTARYGGSYYKRYAEGGKLYIFINKKNPVDRYQLYMTDRISDIEFRNKHNQSFDPYSVFDNDVIDFIKTELNYDMDLENLEPDYEGDLYQDAINEAVDDLRYFAEIYLHTGWSHTNYLFDDNELNSSLSDSARMMFEFYTGETDGVKFIKKIIDEFDNYIHESRDVDESTEFIIGRKVYNDEQEVIITQEMIERRTDNYNFLFIQENIVTIAEEYNDENNTVYYDGNNIILTATNPQYFGYYNKDFYIELLDIEYLFEGEKLTESILKTINKNTVIYAIFSLDGEFVFTHPRVEELNKMLDIYNNYSDKAQNRLVKYIKKIYNEKDENEIEKIFKQIDSEWVENFLDSQEADIKNQITLFGESKNKTIQTRK